MKIQTKLTHKRELKITHYKQNDIEETKIKWKKKSLPLSGQRTEIGTSRGATFHYSSIAGAQIQIPRPPQKKFQAKPKKWLF